MVHGLLKLAILVLIIYLEELHFQSSSFANYKYGPCDKIYQTDPIIITTKTQNQTQHQSLPAHLISPLAHSSISPPPSIIYKPRSTPRVKLQHHHLLPQLSRSIVSPLPSYLHKTFTKHQLKLKPTHLLN